MDHLSIVIVNDRKHCVVQNRLLFLCNSRFFWRCVLLLYYEISWLNGHICHFNLSRNGSALRMRTAQTSIVYRQNTEEKKKIYFVDQLKRYNFFHILITKYCILCCYNNISNAWTHVRDVILSLATVS